MPVNFTYKNKTDDPINHSKTTFPASNNKSQTLKYSPQHKQQVHIKFRFNTCD